MIRAIIKCFLSTLVVVPVFMVWVIGNIVDHIIYLTGKIKFTLCLLLLVNFCYGTTALIGFRGVTEDQTCANWVYNFAVVKSSSVNATLAGDQHHLDKYTIVSATGTEYLLHIVFRFPLSKITNRNGMKNKVKNFLNTYGNTFSEYIFWVYICTNDNIPGQCEPRKVKILKSKNCNWQP